MKLADKVTALRLILGPVFFIVYLTLKPNGSLSGNFIFLIILWVLFIIIECSDWLDGKIARRYNEVNDFGKLFDPFADTLVRILYFLCFILTGILPVIPFMLILYREFGILFLRILMMKKGVAMGARMGGKLKAVCYMLTGLICLLSVTMECFGFLNMAVFFRHAAFVMFILSMVIAIASFIDYFLVYLRAGNSRE